jgi:hypothetical protein
LANGDVLVAVTTDEAHPETVQPFGRPHFWDYRGRSVTQYWRVPPDDVRADLVCAVNVRFRYWRSRRAIPGGVAFENIELRQAFRDGQTFVFGITPAPPRKLLHRSPADTPRPGGNGKP